MSCFPLDRPPSILLGHFLIFFLSSMSSFYDSSSSVPHSPVPLIHPQRFPSLSSLPYPRLLLPTVRYPRSNVYHLPSSPPLPVPHKSPKIKSSSSRSSRSRITSPQPTPDLQDASITIGQLWLGKSANFEIIHDQLELEGFQLFAVEKWSVLVSSSLACLPGV